jgi:hypothetical protein
MTNICSHQSRTEPALATPLHGDDAKRAARALRRKHPVLQGILVPLLHRVMRCGTAYFELRAFPDAGDRPLAPHG